MRADFSLACPVGHLIMGDGSGPDGLAEKDGAKALSRAESGDTATIQLNKPSRTKNLIIEFNACKSLPNGLTVNFPPLAPGGPTGNTKQTYTLEASSLLDSESLLNERTMTRPWQLYATISASVPLWRHGHKGVG